MRIFSIQLGNVYSSDPEKKKALLIRRDYLLQECGIVLAPRNPEDEESYLSYNHSQEIIVTGDQLLNMISRKIEYTMKHEANIKQEPATLIDALQKALDKINNLSVPFYDSAPNFNEKVEVHVPGNLLMTFNQSMLLSDSCTDALQDQLNAGWRVIAVCPQPDQRRPDYILGRYNPDPETFRSNSAVRG